VPFDVPSPLGSPLVVRWGALEVRGGGIFRSWSGARAVLTNAGVLHVFGAADDVATSKDGIEGGDPSGVKTLRPVGGGDKPWDGVFPEGKAFGGLKHLEDKDARDLTDNLSFNIRRDNTTAWQLRT
jgi:hypothetical protein